LKLVIKALAIILPCSLILAALFWFSGSGAMKNCLDKGGRWNEKSNCCEYQLRAVDTK
jgi:hypothetical protein